MPHSPLLLRARTLSQLSWLNHGFGTRACGLTRSKPPECEHGRLRMLRQVHSDLIWRDPVWLQAGDGLMTRKTGAMLSVRTADCCPVLLADTRLRAVAAVHEGWKGTLNRIAEKAVGEMRAAWGSDPAHIRAAIGPCIGPCCYEVGGEIVQAFEARFSYAAELFQAPPDDPVRNRYPMLFMTAAPPGHAPDHPYDTRFNPAQRPRLNLAEALRFQLRDAGIPSLGTETIGLCTRCHPQLFYSHRGGDSGRMMSAIVIN